MIGGIEETSASFEARSAPRSYPTNPDLDYFAIKIQNPFSDKGPGDADALFKLGEVQSAR